MCSPLLLYLLVCLYGQIMILTADSFLLILIYSAVTFSFCQRFKQVWLAIYQLLVWSVFCTRYLYFNLDCLLGSHVCHQVLFQWPAATNMFIGWRDKEVNINNWEFCDPDFKLAHILELFGLSFCLCLSVNVWFLFLFVGSSVMSQVFFIPFYFSGGLLFKIKLISWNYFGRAYIKHTIT